MHLSPPDHLKFYLYIKYRHVQVTSLFQMPRCTLHSHQGQAQDGTCPRVGFMLPFEPPVRGLESLILTRRMTVTGESVGTVFLPDMIL